VKRKGQITTFIIVGLVFLLVIGIALFMRDYVAKGKLEVALLEKPLPPEFEGIRTFVQECTAGAAIPGLYLIGAQGGYLLPPNDSLLTGMHTFSYGYRDGERTLPSKERIEKEIDSYMHTLLSTCIGNLTFFEDRGYTITAGVVQRIESTITEDSVLIRIDAPITAVYLGETQVIDTFVARVPLRLGHLHDVANDIIHHHGDNPGSIDFTYLASFDVHVSVLPLDEGVTGYALYDNATATGEFFLFMFAIEDTESNIPPKLGFIRNFVLTRDERFEYEVQVYDANPRDTLRFTTDNPQFPIDERLGIFNLTPQRRGIFDVTVTVRDRAGATDSRTARFIVEEPIGGETG